MKKLLSFILLSLFSISAYAWNHSIEFGYGASHDPNGSRYRNSGFLLSGDMFPLHRTPKTFWSVTGSLGQWYTTAPDYKNVTTGAVSVALRWYPISLARKYPAYLFGSIGPALLSHKRYGVNTQGSVLTFQTNLGLGAEFNHFDINLRAAHYSNAGFAPPNDGFNVLYLLSFGYLF